ncbi:MAG: GIY-YIG nuclease family protein, partial [Gemmataceae bacterium]|nr:GIY-YIG nuclease family protein [Gemmataceae bacterium]
KLKRGTKRNAPKHPGVYGMLDNRDRLIYVGKAKNLRARLLCYFRENSRDPKAGKIIEQTRRLVWERTGDEFAALLRELELIQRLRPRYNVLGVPGLQRHHYICVGKSPAPYVFVTAAPPDGEAGVYGPFVKWGKSDDAARRLNDWFRLRDCPQTVPLSFAEQGELFDADRGAKCLRYELNTCAGPCVGACTRSDYSAAVREVKAFLDGRNRTVLRTLQSQMEAAAGRYEFEKAASLRDKLQALQWLDDRLSLLRSARNRNSFVYPLTGVDGQVRWYLIHRGEVQAVAFAPDVESAPRVGELLATAFADRPAPAVLSDVTVDSVLLVAAWFQKRPDERAKLLPRAAAESLCRSPGGQASGGVNPC